LFFTQNQDGEVQWFQLCYERDTWCERVLEWRRGRGFQHLKVRDGDSPISKDMGELVLDGVMPYLNVVSEFERSSPGLPAEIAAFVAEKVREYARPARKFPRFGVKTPRWIERMRERERIAARLRFLDSAEPDR